MLRYIIKWFLADKWDNKDLIEFGVNNWQRHSHEMSAFGVILNCIKDGAIVEILVTVIGRKILAKIFERLVSSKFEQRELIFYYLF